MANRETKIIGLALVSTPAAALVERVYYATGKRLKGKFDEDNPAHRRLLVMPSTVAKLEEARMLRVIDQVTKSHSPRVICFNELAFPASNGRARRGFLQELSRRAEEKDCLVLAGTSHDAITLFNSARVFLPGAGPAGVVFVNTGKAHKGNGVALFGFGQRIDASSKPPWIGDLVEENVDGCQVTHVELIHDTFRYRRTGLRSGKLRRGHPLFGLPTIASD